MDFGRMVKLFGSLFRVADNKSLSEIILNSKHDNIKDL
jgi:hypothetical protein